MFRAAGRIYALKKVKMYEQATPYPVTPAIQSDSGVSAGPEIETIERFNDAEWDCLVRTHADATFFHTSQWQKVLRESYGYRPCYFLSRSGERLTGLLPTMEIESWLTGRRAVAIPFADRCPPLVSTEVGLHDLLTRAVTVGEERRWRYLEWRGRQAGQQLKIPIASRYLQHSIDLRQDTEDLLARCHSSIRRGVRKAKRMGIQVKIDETPGAVSSFYELHCKARKHHGLPPQPFRFFKSISRRILSPGNGKIFIAEKDGRPIAGAMFFHGTSEVMLKFAGSDRRFQQLRPNNLVMWEAVRYYVKSGFHSLYLGRTDPRNRGLRDFKNRWGASESPLCYFRYNLKAGDPSARPSSEQGWYNQWFRILPSPLSRMIGALVYRHLG